MQESEIVNEKEKISWKPLLRQIFICTGVWSSYFIMGLSFGTPTVLIPQLRAANITISDENASWLPATFGYSGIPWIIILCTLTSTIGRKKAYLTVNISGLIGYLILYFSSTVSQIFISQIFQGAIAASYMTTLVAIITEFTSAKYRGLFLTLKSATFFWGILTTNAIGTFFSWKYIVITGLLCIVYNLICIPFWPESPYWLAGKGKFVECSKSHKWLKGNSAESLIELENLIRSHEGNILVNQNNLRKTIKTVFRKASIKPILLSSFLICLYSFSGKLICTVYAIDILKKITKDTWTAYMGMLILDCVTVASMYLGCVLTKTLNRRMMLFIFSSFGIFFLFSLSIYLYLVKLDILTQNTYISIALLAAFSIAISCGPMILSTSIIGELLPLESRSIFMAINAFLFKFIYATFMKISPYFFKHINMHGTFFLYGVLSTIFLVILYFYLPETKNKTLQEINGYFQKDKPIVETQKLMTIQNRRNYNINE